MCSLSRSSSFFFYIRHFIVQWRNYWQWKQLQHIIKFMVIIHWKGHGNGKFILKFKHGLLNTKTNTRYCFTKDMLNSCRDESFYTIVKMCFYNRFLILHINWEPWLATFQHKMSFKSMNKLMSMYKVSCEALAHRSVLHARLRTGGTGWWG